MGVSTFCLLLLYSVLFKFFTVSVAMTFWQFLTPPYVSSLIVPTHLLALKDLVSIPDGNSWQLRKDWKSLRQYLRLVSSAPFIISRL